MKRKHGWGLGGVVLLLSACAAMPEAASRLGWRDLWGDRGRGVLERDYRWCADAVESRRSALRPCMVERGWRLDD